MNTVDSWSEGLARAWGEIAAFVPNLIAFLLILVIGYFVALLLGKAVDKILDRVGLDKAVERGGIKKAMEKSGYHISDILGKIVFYTVFLFVLQLAFGVFGPNPISAILTDIIAFLPNIFVAIIIVVIAASIAEDPIERHLVGPEYAMTLRISANSQIRSVSLWGRRSSPPATLAGEGPAEYYSRPDILGEFDVAA